MTELDESSQMLLVHRMSFVDSLAQRGVDVHTIESGDPDIDFLPQGGDDDNDISTVDPELFSGSIETITPEIAGDLDTVTGSGSGRSRNRSRNNPPTTSTPNRPPGQAAGPANTTYHPRGVGRARVDPAVSMVSANVVDIFPVAYSQCLCEAIPADRAEWLNPAQNSHGHSVKLACRVMPEIERFFRNVLAEPECPYKTVEDVMRHAINRHVFWLNRKWRQADHFLVAIKTLKTMAHDDMIQQEIEDTLPPLIKQIRRHVSKRRIHLAGELIQQAREIITGVVEDSHREGLSVMFEQYVDTLLAEITKHSCEGTVVLPQLEGAGGDQ